jgi:hypothetical protein
VASEEPNIVYCMGGSGDVGLLLENRPRSTTMPYQSVNSVSSGSHYAGRAPEPIYENVPLPWAADGRVAGNSLRIHVLITGHKLEDNIKMDFREIVFLLAQDIV